MGVPAHLKDTKTFRMVTGFDTDGEAQAFTFNPVTQGLLVTDKFNWQDKRLDWTSGNLDYSGYSTTSGAATNTGDLWYVYKFTWSSGDLTRIQGPVNGNWDDRATLF